MECTCYCTVACTGWPLERSANTSCISCGGEPQQGYATCNTSCISGAGELQQGYATCNTSCISGAGELQQGYATCNTSCISGVGELQQSCATRAVYPVLENLSKAVQHATRAVHLVLENVSKTDSNSARMLWVSSQGDGDVHLHGRQNMCSQVVVMSTGWGGPAANCLSMYGWWQWWWYLGVKSLTWLDDDASRTAHQAMGE